MNTEELTKLYQAYTQSGLYTEPFDRIDICVHRLIEYANNVLLVESDSSTADEVLIAYAIHDEATRCLYWSEENAFNFIKGAIFREFPIDFFKALYKSHFRSNKIFDKVDTKEVTSIYGFNDPAYNDWCGEFFISTREKKCVLMWDYSD